MDGTEDGSPSHFKEAALVIRLVAELSACDEAEVNAICSRIAGILDGYQEEGSLLDSHLEGLVAALAQVAHPRGVGGHVHRHGAYRLLAVLCKVRGRKVIVRLLPHEAKDLQPTLALLLAQDRHDHTTWETRYVLLLWLGLLCLLPFDLALFDEPMPGAGGQRLVDVLVETGRSYLGANDRCAEAAGIMLARLLTRRDMEKERLQPFVEWAGERAKVAADGHGGGSGELLGILHTLVALFKHGSRATMQRYVPLATKLLPTLEAAGSSSSLARRQAHRLTTQLALSHLPPRPRHTVALPSLATNLGAKNTGATYVAEHDADEGVSEDVEEAVGGLLAGLNDRDTVVRWAAAKGLGAIAERLPSGAAWEVCQGVVGLCEATASHSTWHGACLALAELARRGLLPAQELGCAVDVVVLGLAYDRLVGSHSVGGHVRDAACYVAWALARAYKPAALGPHSDRLALALLAVALYDREVNCRRAASAALQEHVGRHGLVAHGISLVGLADYYSLGPVHGAYLRVAPLVAAHEPYGSPLARHLVGAKVGHWDQRIRALAAEGLALLVPHACSYVATEALPLLVANATSRDLPTRHGALLALTHVLPQLHVHTQGAWTEQLPAGTLDTLLALPQTVHSSRLVSGAGTDHVRSALCALTASLAATLPRADHAHTWHLVVASNLQHDNEHVQAAAACALTALCSHTATQPLAPTHIQGLGVGPQHHFRGAAMALGALPRAQLAGHVGEAVRGLAGLLGSNKVAPETKCAAVKALADVCTTVGVGPDIGAEEGGVVVGALLAGLGDYTVDHRGDIGSTVREASLCACVRISALLAPRGLLDQPTCTRLLCAVIEQAWGRIDRTRCVGGPTLISLIHMQPALPLAHHSDLQAAYPQTLQTHEWGQASSTYPLACPLLSLPAYRQAALLALASAAGSTAESTVRHGSSSLLGHVTLLAPEQLQVIGCDLLLLLQAHRGEDRVVVPLLKASELLLTNGCFDLHPDWPTLGLGLVEAARAQMGSADFGKLAAAMGLLCALLQREGPVRTQALMRLMLLLAHRFPRLRRLTAEQLHVGLMTWEVGDVTTQGQVLDVLETANWGGDLDTVRPHRDQLCGLLGLPVPRQPASKQQ